MHDRRSVVEDDRAQGNFPRTPCSPLRWGCSSACTPTARFRGQGEAAVEAELSVIDHRQILREGDEHPLVALPVRESSGRVTGTATDEVPDGRRRLRQPGQCSPRTVQLRDRARHTGRGRRATAASRPAASATNNPSEVSGSASRSAASSCTMIPLSLVAPVKSPTTTPSTVRTSPTSGLTDPVALNCVDQRRPLPTLAAGAEGRDEVGGHVVRRIVDVRVANLLVIDRQLASVVRLQVGRQVDSPGCWTARDDAATGPPRSQERRCTSRPPRQLAR